MANQTLTVPVGIMIGEGADDNVRDGTLVYDSYKQQANILSVQVNANLGGGLLRVVREFLDGTIDLIFDTPLSAAFNSTGSFRFVDEEVNDFTIESANITLSDLGGGLVRRYRYRLTNAPSSQFYPRFEGNFNLTIDDNAVPPIPLSGIGSGSVRVRSEVWLFGLARTDYSFLTGIAATATRVLILNQGLFDETDSKVFFYDHEGTRYANEEWNLDVLNDSPFGIALTATRALVVDVNVRKVFVYGHDGTRYADEDWNLDPLNTGSGIAVTATRALVTDLFRSKVFVYGHDGTRYADEDWNLDAQNESPVGITATATRALVLDPINNKVFVYGLDGTRYANEDWNLIRANQFGEFGIAVTATRTIVAGTNAAYTYELDGTPITGAESALTVSPPEDVAISGTDDATLPDGSATLTTDPPASVSLTGLGSEQVLPSTITLTVESRPYFPVQGIGDSMLTGSAQTTIVEPEDPGAITGKGIATLPDSGSILTAAPPGSVTIIGTGDSAAGGIASLTIVAPDDVPITGTKSAALMGSAQLSLESPDPETITGTQDSTVGGQANLTVSPAIVINSTGMSSVNGLAALTARPASDRVISGIGDSEIKGSGSLTVEPPASQAILDVGNARLPDGSAAISIESPSDVTISGTATANFANGDANLTLTPAISISGKSTAELPQPSASSLTITVPTSISIAGNGVARVEATPSINLVVNTLRGLAINNGLYASLFVYRSGGASRNLLRVFNQTQQIHSEFALDSANGLAQDVEFVNSTYWVLNRNPNRIFVYDLSGNYQPASSFDLDQRIVNPRGITLLGTNVWIHSNRRLFQYDVDGTYDGTEDFVLPALADNIQSLGNDGENILALDTRDQISYAFTPDGSRNEIRDIDYSGDDTKSITGVGSTGGIYYLLDQAGKVLGYEEGGFIAASEDDVDWDQVVRMTFSGRDADGLHRGRVYEAPDWDVGNLIIAIRRNNPDQDPNEDPEWDQVAFQMTGSILRNIDEDTYTFPVTRTTISDDWDAGMPADIDPGLDENYKVLLLMPALPGIERFPSSRMSGWFWRYISAQLATEMEMLEESTNGDRYMWSAAAIEQANIATPGDNRIGDVVTLYRGEFTSTRSWDGTSWIPVDQFIDGNLLVSGTVTAEAIAANTITANKIFLGDGIIAGDDNALTLNFKENTGLALTDEGIFLVVKDNSGLALTKEGLEVVVKPDVGLKLDKDGLQVVVGSNSGLMLGRDGLEVVVDSTTVTVDSTGLHVGTITGDNVASTTIGAGKIKLGNAIIAGDADTLTLGVSGNGLAVGESGLAMVVKDSSALALTTDGLAVTVKDDSALSLTSDGLAVVVSDNSALKLGTEGLAVQVKSNAGLSTGEDGLEVAVQSNAGLSLTSSGLAVNVDSAGALTTGADGLGVAVQNNAGLSLTSSGLAVNINSGMGLSVGADGLGVAVQNNAGLSLTSSGLAVNINSGMGLSVGADGLGVAVQSSNSGLALTSQGLAVNVDSTGGLSNGKDGLGVVVKNNAGLALTSQGLEITVKSGSGIATDKDGLALQTDGTTVKIGTSGIEVNSITRTNIAKDTIQAAQIDASTITAAELKDKTIIGTKISDNAIATNHITAGAIVADKIAANAVTVDKIGSGTYTKPGSTSNFFSLDVSGRNFSGFPVLGYFQATETANVGVVGRASKGGIGVGGLVAGTDLTDSIAGAFRIEGAGFDAHEFHILTKNYMLEGFDLGTTNIREFSLDYSGNLVTIGEVTATDVNATSDIRLKDNLERIENALEKIMSISGYTYLMKEQEKAGVVAQEIEKVLPEAVKENGGFLTVSPLAIIGLLVEGLKELKKEVSDLRRAVDAVTFQRSD